MSEGKLVSDEVVLELLKQAMARAKDGVLLDGFPRNLSQAKALEKILPSTNIKAVLYLELPQELLLERVCGRMSCPKCKAIYHRTFAPPKNEGICDKCQTKLMVRKDDNPQSVKTRLEEYNRQTKPLLEFYKSQNLLVTIDAKATPNEITHSIMLAL